MTHTVMITGANRGIGLELVKQYAKEGWHVIACCRTPDQADNLNSLAGEAVKVHQLDVCSASSVAALSETLQDRAIDHLYNCAGIFGPRVSTFGHVDFDAWEQVMRTNTMSPLRVSEAFNNQVYRSKKRVIINITSKMGSIADNSSGGSYIYRSSKAALNMVSMSMAHDLAARGIIVVAMHPGWVKTDMGGPNALITTQESVANIRRVIANIKSEESGSFFNYDGTPIPW